MSLFTVPLLSWVAGLVDRLLGGTGFQLDLRIFQFSSPLITALMFPVLMVFLLLFGPLPEEMGWRGYALDRLHSRWAPGRQACCWGPSGACGVLPLFFVGGSYQNTLGVGTAGFWLFMAQVIAVTPLMTWIYNHTGEAFSPPSFFISPAT